MGEDLTSLLGGGDRRSPGPTTAIARVAATSPDVVRQLVALCAATDPLLRMRAADALEKASRLDPRVLAPHATTLLGPLADQAQQEVRWHLMQMLPRLGLAPAPRETARAIARRSLDHRSRIVVAEALSCLFALAAGDPGALAEAARCAQRLAQDGFPAVRARARRLLATAAG